MDSDNAKGSYDLTRHLLSSGHRRIGIILGYLTISTAFERLSGIRRAYEEFGVDLDENSIYYGDFTEEEGYLGAEKLMKLTSRPTAILAMNNAVILGALKFLRTHSFDVPADVSVGSFGNIENVELIYVRPTLVSQDPWSIGTKAAELILDRIHDKHLSNREVIFQSELRQGNSVRRL